MQTGQPNGPRVSLFNMGKAAAARVSLFLLAGQLSAAAQAAAPRSCGSILVPVTIQGTDGDDHLVGTEGPDIIDAGAGDDVIEALGGNDLICGQDGNDTIDAGADNDYLSGGRGVDTLEGGSGDDQLRGGGGDDALHGGDENDIVIFDPVGAYESPYYQGEGVRVNLTRGFASGQGSDTLTDIENVDATFGKDRIVGTDGPNFIIGHEGGDFIDAKDGDDTIRAGRGTDRVYAGAGNDTVVAGKVKVQNRIKRIYLGPGDDVLTTYMNSHMEGGPGHDLLAFTYFDYHGERTGVLADMASGHSSGGEEDSTFTGFEDLEGSPGPDRLYGDALDNVIRGLDGNDYLDGRTGTNTLDGGMGFDDCFHYETQTSCE